MDQFTAFMNNDSLLAEIYPSGEVSTDCNNDNFISSDNFTFLHQKLSEATALNASYAQRESHLKNNCDQLKKERQDIVQKYETLQGEIQSYRNRHVTVEQKLDAETRQRFIYQDKLNEVEKSLTEEIKHRNTLQDKIKCLQLSLGSSDDFSREVYKIAEESTRQTENLKEEIRVLEEISSVYKTSFIKVKQENEKLSSNVLYLNLQLKELENTFKEASSDIHSFKEENLKHESYINDTLDRFKEIGVHFANMKDQFLQQQNALEKCNKELNEKSCLLDAMKQELHVKTIESEEAKNISTAQGIESKMKMEKLQETLDELIKVKEDLEQKSKEAMKSIEDLREENIKSKSEVESTKSILSVERNYMAEKRGCIENLSSEKDEWKRKFEDVLAKSIESDKENKELQKERMECIKKTSELLVEIQTSHNTINDLQSQNDWLLNENNALTEQVKEKQRELQTFIEDGNNVEVCLKRRHNELVQRENETIVLKQEKEKFRKENDNLSKNVESLMIAKEASKKKVKEFEDRLIKCQFLFMENDKKYTDILGKCNNLEDEQKVYKDSMNKYSEEIRELKISKHSLNERKEALKYELKEAKEKLENQLNDSDLEAKTACSNMKQITLNIKEELDASKRDCCNKDQMISKLSSKVKDSKSVCDEEKSRLTKANEQIRGLQGRNENLTETISRISEEKLEFLSIIESLQEKETCWENESKLKLLQVKDLEYSCNEHKREFEQFRVNVNAYDCLWEDERKQALSDLQDELSRNHAMLQQFDGRNVADSKR